MQQRYYEPLAGRFLSVDPVTTDASTGRMFNRYNYAFNNPYKFVDPDGRQGVGPTNLFPNFDPMQYLKDFAVESAKFVGMASAGAGGAAIKGLEGAAAVAKAAEAAGGAAKLGEAAGAGAGRAANKLKPVEGAEGAHSAIKTGADGKVTNTATYTPNPKNPSGFDEAKRVDITGRAHTNSDGTKVPTPHVHEAGQKDVRPAMPNELPKK